MVDHKVLLSQVSKGDSKAFELLYSDLSPMLYSTILSHTHNVQSAEEITQDVFVKIFKSANKFKGRSKVSTWAYSIAIRTIIDYQRKGQRDKLSFPEFITPTDRIDSFDSPQVLLEKEELKVKINKVINTLPSNQKSAFILVYVDNLPQQEVSEIMGVTVKAIESLLQRAKTKLRLQLK